MAAPLVLAACDGCEADIVSIAPAIALDVCSDPPLEISGTLVGGVRDCNVDFGEVPLSVRVQKEVRVTNPTPVELSIFSSDFTSDSDPAFRVDVIPETIAEGLTNTMALSFRPLVEGEVTGTLVIESDAQNLATDEDVVINLRGVGFDDGLPRIVVEPRACDFGRVAEGGAASCDVSIRNEGQRDLILEQVEILADTVQAPPDSEAEEPFGFFGRPPGEQDVILPDEGLTVSMRFTPDVLGNFQATLRIGSNDPVEQLIDIPLTGIGVDPPICDAVILSVNGVPVSDGPVQVEPLDDVTISAEASDPSTPDGSIISVNWEIASQPGGSTAQLSNPQGLQTGFTFADGIAGVDLAGTYVVRATVVDDLGTESVNECQIEFEAIPNDTVLTQLSWDAPFGDMDLHLIQKNESGQFCGNIAGQVSESCGFGNDGACYYGNCRQTSSSRPDWDNDGVNGTEGDPSLDIDDLCGFGPENINIDVAVPGEYLVAVDFFGFTGCSGSGVVGNTVRLYLFGQLAGEFFRELEDSDWWEVAILTWNGPETSPAWCYENLENNEVICSPN
jgi:hypothetical protein